MKFITATSAGLAAALALTGCSSPSQLTFVHMTDSQFGFYDYDLEYQRYKNAIALINSDNDKDEPVFMIMTGDMVNIPTAEHNADFIVASNELKIPYYVVPGNHDINAKAEAIELYHNSFGKDYYTFDQYDFRIIVINTNLWKYPQARTAEFDQWFEQALANAKEDGKNIIVAGHSPIFLKDVNEPEDPYYNIEPNKRMEILNLFKKYGVILYVGGHSHTRIDNEWEGIRFLHAENTSTNFDNRPYGFRMVYIKDGVVSDKFVPVNQ